MKQNK